MLHFLFINYATDDYYSKKVIAQLTYLILITFLHGHHFEVDKISTRKETLLASNQIVLSNQMLTYKNSRAIPRLEKVDKIMLKHDPRINLGISCDLRIAIPRFIPFPH